MKLSRLLIIVLVMALVLPLAHHRTSTVQAQGPISARAGADNLNVREQFGLNSRVVGQFSLNETIQVQGREDNLGNGGIWVYATNGNITGWVLSEYIIFPNGYNTVYTLPIVNASGVGPTGDAPIFAVEGSRTAAAVNFRTGPGLNFSRIATLAPGTPIEPQGRNAAGDWVKAIANGQEGWLYYTLVFIPIGVRNLPIVGDVAAEIPASEGPSGSVVGSTTSRVNFRTGPSTGYSIITTLDGGVPVFFTGRNSSNTWFKANANGREGWLYYTLVRVNGNINDLPVVGDQTSSGSPVTAGNNPIPAGSSANLSSFSYGAHIASFSGLELMSAAGMSWVKVQVRYGRGADPNGLAGMINDAHNRGFRILLGIVGYPNDILGGQSYFNDYANYVAGAARLGADAIEIWNEQNLDREWPYGNINPATYTTLLATSYNAIKSANSGTIVISGALAPTGAEGAFGRSAVWNDNSYLAGMRDAGAARYMDCLGAHYNEGIVSPYWSSGDPRDSYYTRYMYGMINTYRAYIAKPICFTELGYLSPEGFGELPGHFAWASGTSLGEQTQWIAEAVQIGRNDSRVALIIIWNFNFQGSPGGDPMGGYAMLRPDGSCPSCNRLAGR